MTTAFVFPGQGSQSIGMLADFASEAPVIDTFREASEILGYDLWSYAQNGPQEWMTLTTNTQPLIYTASVALLRLLAPELSEISCVAGHSLGEYAALVAAQSLSFESGLRLIAFRAQAMHEAFPAGQGAMAAVMGLTPEVVTDTVREISPTVEAVNFNSPQQIVIAGYVEGLTKAEALLKEKGARRVLRLNVSGPFHSSLMNQARERLAQRLATETFAEASISVVQNYNATPTTDAERLKEGLIEQIVKPVYWVDTVQKMASLGVTDIVECGPGKVLCGLIKRTTPEINLFATCDRESFTAAKEHLGSTTLA